MDNQSDGQLFQCVEGITMMTPDRLAQVQQALKATAQQLSEVFAQASSEQSNTFFEEIGAAHYYMDEADNCLESVIAQLHANAGQFHD
jgi:hypothetical protein